jgi:hypothetical protein
MNNTQSYELVYGTGGHGGPYFGIENAAAAAHRLLRGNRTEQRIHIVPRDAPHYEARYAVRTVTRDEACQPEYAI